MSDKPKPPIGFSSSGQLPESIAFSPWLTVNEASKYARAGRKFLYAAIDSGRLRAAAVDGRRKILLRREWLDAWIEASTRIVDIKPKGQR